METPHYLRKAKSGRLDAGGQLLRRSRPRVCAQLGVLGALRESLVSSAPVLIPFLRRMEGRLGELPRRGRGWQLLAPRTQGNGQGGSTRRTRAPGTRRRGPPV